MYRGNQTRYKIISIIIIIILRFRKKIKGSTLNAYIIIQQALKAFYAFVIYAFQTRTDSRGTSMNN